MSHEEMSGSNTDKNTKPNILIVEDDADTAEVITMILTSEGFGVRWSQFRDEAVEMVEAQHYACILMDNFMLGMTAADFVARVRHKSPQTKFILLTATDKVASEAERLGIHRWLKKPFDINELLAAIEITCALK